MRIGLRRNAEDGETWRQAALRVARQHGMEAEVAQAYDDAIKAGDDEPTAAMSALLEWDVAELFSDDDEEITSAVNEPPDGFDRFLDQPLERDPTSPVLPANGATPKTNEAWLDDHAPALPVVKRGGRVYDHDATSGKSLGLLLLCTFALAAWVLLW